jgi:hypothetical protein
MRQVLLMGSLLGVLGCTPSVVAPPPQAVHRIAVLPPYSLRGSDFSPAETANDALNPRQMTVGEVLAEQARGLLAEKGYEVVDPSIVKAATRDRLPTSPQAASQIAREGALDAAAMYIEIRLWEPNYLGMKTDGVIVALDVMLIDPQSGAVLWHARREPRPVPLHGVLLTGQANMFVAEIVMQEVLAPLEPGHPPA